MKDEILNYLISIGFNKNVINRYVNVEDVNEIISHLGRELLSQEEIVYIDNIMIKYNRDNKINNLIK